MTMTAYWFKGDCYCIECVEGSPPCMSEAERARAVREDGVGRCACCWQAFEEDEEDAEGDATESLIHDAVTLDHLATYLTADAGAYFGVYADGTVSVGVDVGEEIAEDERPVVRIRCPGFGALDSTWWTQGTVQDCHGFYWEADGTRIGSLADVVAYCCQEGDVTEELDELRRRLLEAAAAV